MRIKEGNPNKLGASCEEKGINFAIFSKNAEKIELCLFDKSGKKELIRYPLFNSGDIWHAFIPNLEPGTLYGYRVYGEYAPEKGFRFNHHKLLLDPYAKKFKGSLKNHPAIFGYIPDNKKKDSSFNKLDSASYVPKCVAVCESSPKSPTKIDIHPSELIIYEAHIKDISIKNNKIPASKRGKITALSDPTLLKYLKDLGVNAIELLPLHNFFKSSKYVHPNYWGYNSLNYFTIEKAYLEKNEAELQNTVEILHQNGIEVILDVVYNHTYEGNELGPTLCYKGIDNPSYYKLNPENQRFYDNISGCGNTLNFETPEIAELAISSLKHFINQYNIDGFRFDLAPILARKHTGFAPNHYFFQLLSEDPAFDSIKLIAEPWDPGIGGYQLGNFPKNFMEWNDKYRDTVRRYWKGEAGLVDDIAYKITGSSDTFSDKYAFSSINFITCHDGFTLNDLVSYNHKHNELNGENNRDGTDANYSYNWGIEGKTSNRAIKKKRMQAAKNMLASLLLSQGIPMLQGGDELFRTKEGNNNSYLHDNKINWFNWNLLNKNKSIHKFVRYLIKLRKQNQIFRRKTFFTGENIKNTKDITWLKPNLKEFKHKNWHDNSLKSISYLLDSFLQVSNSFFIIMNADHKSHKWHLPKLQNQQYWNLLIDTSKPESIIEKTIKNPTYNVKPYSFILFQSKK